MNVRMADGTARCDEHIDGQPCGDTNDACIYCPEERAQEEAPKALPVIGYEHDGIGWCLVDEHGVIRGVASTFAGAKILHRRIMRRLTRLNAKN